MFPFAMGVRGATRNHEAEKGKNQQKPPGTDLVPSIAFHASPH